VGLAALLALAGCVNPASEVPEVAGASILGGWELAPGTTCLETLAFRPDGRFAHGIAALAAGWPFQLRLGGAFTGGPETGPDGSLPLQLLPERAAPAPALAHCAQWGAAGAASLPLGLLADGTDAATLAWRPVPLAGGAWGWVGTDANAADRLVLLRAGDRLRAFLPDAGLEPGVTRFHREARGLPEQDEALLFIPLLHLPQQAYAASVPAGPSRQLLLVLHSAVEVSVLPQPGPAPPPLCTLAAWDGPLYINELSSNPFADIATTPTVALNPGDPDPAGPVIAQALPGSEELDDPSYLVALEVRAPDAASCSVNIRARPLVARLAEAHLDDLDAVDAFAVELAAGPAYLLGEPVGQPGALALAPLAGGQPWPLRRLVPRIVQPPQAAADPLGLAAGAATDLRVSVQREAGAHYLNIFPAEGEGAGLGPFGAHGPAGGALTAELPGSVPLALPDAGPVALRFQLAAPGLVEAYTDGGPETRATLRDGDGTPLALARGGAADGAGFRLVASLPAGSYELQVQALAPPAAVTLHLAQPADVPDLAPGALVACLHGANAPGSLPAALRTADCRARGIDSLDGIDAGGGYDRLQALRLDDNPLADLAPLAPLFRLAELSLAGTAPASLAPLAVLPRLHALTLARVPLDAAALDVLAGLGTRLTYLDLSGATGLTPEDITLLRAALPNTRLVAPDGTVYE
jgi:hypothetical protein